MDRLEEYIERELPINKVIQYDQNIQNLFEYHFYNVDQVSSLNDDSTNRGLLQNFIKSLKHLKERSYLLRTLPTFLSGKFYYFFCTRPVFLLFRKLTSSLDRIGSTHGVSQETWR